MVLRYGSHLVHQGKNSTGEIVTAFMSALIAAEAVEQVLPQMIVLEKGRAAGFTLRATQVQVERGRRIGRMVGTLKPSVIEGNMELKNVRSYQRHMRKPLTILGVFFISFNARKTHTE